MPQFCGKHSLFCVPAKQAISCEAAKLFKLLMKVPATYAQDFHLANHLPFEMELTRKFRATSVSQLVMKEFGLDCIL